MATFPFTRDIESLLPDMEAIPIDESVPFADGFKKVMAETEGNPWGPQALPRSKLATRLHFAGWTRQQLEEVGLKPKDVENFRRKYQLTQSRAGRPSGPAMSPEGARWSSAAPTADGFLAGLKERRQLLMAQVDACTEELQRIEEAIRALEK